MFEKNQLNPGKRANAFYIKSYIEDKERIGDQSIQKKHMLVYLWDSSKKRHVCQIVKKGKHDTL